MRTASFPHKNPFKHNPPQNQLPLPSGMAAAEGQQQQWHHQPADILFSPFSALFCYEREGGVGGGVNVYIVEMEGWQRRT